MRHGAIAVALADGWATAGDLDRALGILEEALALGESSGEELVTIASHTSAAMALYYLGRYREAQDHLERAQKLYQPERHDFLAAGFHENKGVNLMSWSAWIQWQLGLTERAWQSAERAIEIARSHDDPFGLSFAVNWASVTALLLRDFGAARELGSEAARLAGEQGSPMLEALARMTEHFSIGILGEDPDASTHFAPLLGQAAATGSRLGTTVILAFLVELQLSEGRVAEATGMVEMALASGREAGQPCFDARLLELKGLCLQRAGGGDDKVESLLREAVATAHGQSALSFELRAATSLARTLGERDRAGEGAALLAPILEALPEGRELPDGIDADSLLAKLRAR